MLSSYRVYPRLKALDDLRRLVGGSIHLEQIRALLSGRSSVDPCDLGAVAVMAHHGQLLRIQGSRR